MPNIQDFARYAPFSFDQLIKAANSILREKPRLQLSPRTVRYYMAEGVVPAPIGSTRNARYENEHLARLVGIRLLQDQGLSISDANVLLTEWAASGQERLAEEVGRIAGFTPSLDNQYMLMRDARLANALAAESQQDESLYALPPDEDIVELHSADEEADLARWMQGVRARPEVLDVPHGAESVQRFTIIPGVVLEVREGALSELDAQRVQKHIKLLLFRLNIY